MMNNVKIKKLSNNQIKLINSLKTKKYRYKHKLFLVEGEKSCKELIENSKNLISFFVIPENNIKTNNILLKQIVENNKEIFGIENQKFKSLSDTKTPQEILAVVSLIPQKFIKKSPIIILDNISDPGNLGTIIRSMDWFGINQLVLSKNCVDIFSPKVIRSTMGSIFRINYFIPNDLKVFITNDLADFEIIGTSIDTNVFIDNYNFPDNFAIIIGNEAKGISPELMEIITRKIKIQGFGKAESLNASVACSIILYEIAKKIH